MSEVAFVIAQRQLQLMSNTLSWLHSSSTTLQRKTSPNKTILHPCCLARLLGQILYFASRPGLSGLDWEKGGRADKHQARRPGLPPSSPSSVRPLSICLLLGLDDYARATDWGIFNWRDFLEPDNGTIHRLEQHFEAHFTPPCNISSSDMLSETNDWETTNEVEQSNY